MPAFQQNGTRLQIPLRGALKRPALSANVFDSFESEKKHRPLQRHEYGAPNLEQHRSTDGNGKSVVGPGSMQERLRLASSSFEAVPSFQNGNSSQIQDVAPKQGHRNGVERLSEHSGATLANEGREQLTNNGASADCQPVPISMFPEFLRPGIGFTNLGNTCYLNSVLQCLLHTPPLHNLLRDKHHSDYCEYRGRKAVDGFCPLCLLENRLKASFEDELQRYPRPLVIAKNLHHFAPQLRIGDQEDAHELLRLMIDSCHRTCLLQQRGLPLTALKRFEDRTGKVPTVISDIFGGILQSQVKCLSCGAESNKRDVFMDLSLDISAATHSVSSALQAFIAAETLDGSNKYRCEKCKQLSRARKQMQILKAPNVLVIQLKRFENIYGGKITRHIQFYETLTLAGVMAPGSREPRPEYTLYALIVHEGSTQQGGHYYAYARVNRSWYEFNDSNVSQVNWTTVSRRGAYILFYIKTRPRGTVFFYPPKSQGPVTGGLHSGQQGGQGLGAAPESRTGPVYGPQLPPGYRGPVSPTARVETPGTLREGQEKAHPAGPVYGPQLPQGSRGPVGTVSGPVEVSKSRSREDTAAAGPFCFPQLPRGPVDTVIAGTEGSSQPHPQPAGPASGPPAPPEVFTQGLNSQGVTVEGTSRIDCEKPPKPSAGPVPAPLREAAFEATTTNLSKESQPKPLKSTFGESPVAFSQNQPSKPIATAPSRSADESTSRRNGAEPYDLKRRLSNGEASEESEPKKRPFEGRSAAHCENGGPLSESARESKCTVSAATAKDQALGESVNVGPVRESGLQTAGVNRPASGQENPPWVAGVNSQTLGSSNSERISTSSGAQGSHRGFDSTPSTGMNGGPLQTTGLSERQVELSADPGGGSAMLGIGRSEKVESDGAPAGRESAGGKVELLVEASAWSLAYSYGSDEDEECAEMLKQVVESGLSTSPRVGVPNEGLGLGHGSGQEIKQLPGLIEAEALLRMVDGRGVSGLHTGAKS